MACACKKKKGSVANKNNKLNPKKKTVVVKKSK